MYLFISRTIQQNGVIIEEYHFCQLRTKSLSDILLSRLTPYEEEINGDHQCGFQRNRSTTDHIFCIRQILSKKVGIKLGSASALYRIQESLLFS